MHLKTGPFEDPRQGWRLLMAAITLLLCLTILFRFQLSNGFTVLQGDRFDGVIVSVILEHWFHVFTQGANWLEVGYFFPYTRTIAQTDGYFLIGLAYLPFRLIGLDPFLAMDLASLCIKATGFAGMYLLCRRIFKLPFYWTLLASILFTLNNAMTIHSWRFQLATVALAPILSLLLCRMGQAFFEGKTVQFRQWGVAAGLLYGAWCLTCFYMAWFFVFFFVPVFLVLLRMGGTTYRTVLGQRLVEQYRSALLPDPAPAGCRVFYVSGWDPEDGVGTLGDTYTHNVTAMYIAQQTGIPTVNGVASFNPPDWAFDFPNRPDYDQRVLGYATRHQLTGMCKLDLNTKRWSLVDVPLLPTITETTTLDLTQALPSATVRHATGLSTYHPWGTWSDAANLTVEFARALPPRVTVRLQAYAYGPNIGKTFIAHVGDSAVKFTLSAVSETRILVFDNASGSFSITIDVPEPTSPKIFQQELDERTLGINMSELSILVE